MRPPHKEKIDIRISPDLLDTIGKSFKFRHGKGISEWLKNSLDNYLRLRSQNEEPMTGNWPVLLDIIDGDKSKPGPHLAVIDFGGTHFDAIQNFFLYWGDTSAATHGGRFSHAPVTGGHGNGGKFYMREMWKDGARFLTWRDGHLTSLIVAPGDQSYWEYKNITEPNWRNALNAALPEKEGLGTANKIIQHLEHHQLQLVDDLDTRQRGFTAVVGRRAKQILSSNDVVRGRKWQHQQLIDEIRSAPQARRPIYELRISVLVNGEQRLARLEQEPVSPDPDWPDKEWPVPGTTVGNHEARIGTLRLRKAAPQLVGRLREHNVISIIDGGSNPIAWYPLNELPVVKSPILPFIHGELEINFKKISELIANDRERLIPCPQTQNLLEFVATKIKERVEEIEQTERARERAANLERASILNESLNQHARRFLEQVQTEIMVDFLDNETGGGPGPHGRGSGRTEGTGPHKTGRQGTGGGPGEKGAAETPGERTRAKRPRFPVILLSGYDEDPSNNKRETKHLTKMHPPLYQDDVDRNYNIWWINTMHPFAGAALAHGGPKGSAFKSHQLFMFRDVVQREAMRMLQRREAEVALDRLETELDEISNRFLGELPVDLIDELLSSATTS